jgi:hypothetical protein
MSSTIGSPTQQIETLRMEAERETNMVKKHLKLAEYYTLLEGLSNHEACRIEEHLAPGQIETDAPRAITITESRRIFAIKNVADSYFETLLRNGDYDLFMDGCRLQEQHQLWQEIEQLTILKNQNRRGLEICKKNMIPVNYKGVVIPHYPPQSLF